MLEHLKRVLFIQHAGIGGATVSLSQIIRKLDRGRFEPFVLLLRNDSAAIELLRSCGANVVVDKQLAQFRHVIGGWDSLLDPVSLYYSLRSLLGFWSSRTRFRRLIEQIRPDLVYLNSLCLFHYACVAHALGIPVVLHVREVFLDGMFGLRKRLYQRAIERCVTKTIFIGEFEKERLGIVSDNEVIPNYVDLRVWRTQADTSDQVAATASRLYPTLLFTGGANGIKGPLILLRALAILKLHYPHFRCVVLGFTPPSGRWKWAKHILRLLSQRPLTEQILDILRRDGLSDHCVLKPFVLDPVSEYAQADLLVFPSTVPHFPRPIIEAGAMGLPVVASDLPGPRDVVVHGQTGLLVPPNDPAALAEALLTLLSNPELRQEMGAAGRRIVEERFDGAINEPRILDIIESLCMARRDLQ